MILLLAANIVLIFDPICFTSVFRFESRAEADWVEKERKAIEARMAKMTIVTISSTRVKALLSRNLYFSKLMSEKIKYKIVDRAVQRFYCIEFSGKIKNNTFFCFQYLIQFPIDIKGMPSIRECLVYLTKNNS